MTGSGSGPAPLRASAVGVLGLALAGLAAAPPGLLLVNETPSLPRGVYAPIPGTPGRGSIVALRAPPVASAYLRGLGAPADLQLLKRVAAEGGERVCAGAGVLRVGARVVPVRRRDRRRDPLPAWNQCRRLAADEVLLLGDSVTSFDSRYFGPVRRAELTGPYVRVWGW